MKCALTKSTSLKTFLCAVLGIGMGVMAFSPGQATPSYFTLTVVVKHELPASGQVKVSVFNSQSTFLKSPYAQKQTHVGTEGETIINFENLPAGDYAVSAIHDQDANGKLNRNFIGKPREPFGFSNNVRVRFAPPAFDKTKFTVTEQDETIVIDLES